MKSAAKQLISEGWARIDNLIGPTTIDRTFEYFQQHYLHPDLGTDAEDLDAFEFPCSNVGDRRYMMAIGFRGAFANPDIFGNPLVVQTLRETLGPDFFLESFGAVLSLPGSDAQHLHRDGGGGLFGVDLDSLLPAHAVTVVIPLVDMNAEHGTTRIWPGTHRTRGDFDAMENIDKSVTPDVPRGSCVMWDYRLFHHGNPNRSQTPRPILYMTYARPWFSDRSNWGDKVGLFADDAFLATVPEDLKFLFRYCR